MTHELVVRRCLKNELRSTIYAAAMRAAAPTIADLARETGAHWSTVDHHVRALAAAGLVRIVPRGRRRHVDVVGAPDGGAVHRLAAAGSS